MSQSRARYALLTMVIGALVAGCSPAAPAAPVSSTAPPSATSSPAPTTSATTQPTATAGATARATAAQAQVDLTFTGSHPFTAKGSAGRCVLGTPVGGGLARFGFEATEADYPGIGLSFSLAQIDSASDYVDLKWQIDGSSAYSRPDPGQSGSGTITLSADHHSVQIDTDLSGLAPRGQPAPGPEHVSGTITCP